jgi:hypothetical protein
MRGIPGGGLGVSAARMLRRLSADEALEKASEGETAACHAGVDQEARREEGHQMRHGGLIIAALLPLDQSLGRWFSGVVHPWGSDRCALCVYRLWSPVCARRSGRWTQPGTSAFRAIYSGIEIAMAVAGSGYAEAFLRSLELVP